MGKNTENSCRNSNSSSTDRVSSDDDVWQGRGRNMEYGTKYDRFFGRECCRVVWFRNWTVNQLDPNKKRLSLASEWMVNFKPKQCWKGLSFDLSAKSWSFQPCFFGWLAGHFVTIECQKSKQCQTKQTDVYFLKLLVIFSFCFLDFLVQTWRGCSLANPLDPYCFWWLEWSYPE